MNDPTGEQLAVINEPATASVLVTAGPGTGKTFTLVRRALALSETVTADVVVLSFTRAVVTEIRERTLEEGGGAITASTIDAYAARLLARAGDPLEGDFDDTIRAATVVVRDGPAWLASLGHVLVDEVQDLVEPRLAFVIELLSRADGFTCFGDERQAIFGFQDQAESDTFRRLHSAFPCMRSLTLSEVHRGKVREQLEGRSELPSGPELLQDARPLANLRQFGLVARGGDTVLLTRTNGEALLVADMLADLGYSASVRQGATTRMAPKWVARFANDSHRSDWTRRQVTQALRDIPDTPPDGDAWKMLRRLAGKDDRILLERLRRAVAMPHGYDDFGQRGAPTEISTVHRAKGLEWDEVVVLEHRDGDELTHDEERVVFVAATRARREVWRLPALDAGGRLARSKRDGRWEILSWRKSYPMRFEVRLGDVLPSMPYGGERAEEVQRVLCDEVAALDPVDLVLDDAARSRYRLEHRDGLIGQTTEGFGEAVSRRWGPVPGKVTGARILAVRTAAGDPQSSADAGLPATGLWLVPEIVGLVRPDRGDET